MKELNGPRSRRSILQLGAKSLAAAGVASAFSDIALGAAGGDRAVVSIMLLGGADSSNMLVPYEGSHYDRYARLRGQLAVPRTLTQPVAAPKTGTTLAFHPSLREVAALYSSGAVAIIANEGVLARQISPREVAANFDLPKGLFLHTAGNPVKYLHPATVFPMWAARSQRAGATAGEPGHQVFKFQGMAAMSLDRTRLREQEIDSAMRAVTLRTPFPETTIGESLRNVAQVLKVSSGLGLTKPVFSVGMSGWDTHTDQVAREPQLYSELSQAMAAFYEATQELGIARQVTTYTHSEFGRSLTMNAGGGTEHGWGGHQLVMGGAVLGGTVYGKYPTFEPSDEEFSGPAGFLIPTTPDALYESTIARWHSSSHSAIAAETSAFAKQELNFLLA